MAVESVSQASVFHPLMFTGLSVCLVLISFSLHNSPIMHPHFQFPHEELMPAVL